ncbi:hypothetical protein E4U22_002570, partial [Claviceps purpurea]
HTSAFRTSDTLGSEEGSMQLRARKEPVRHFVQTLPWPITCYGEDEFFDGTDPDTLSYSFLMLEASNLSDTNIAVPRNWFEAKILPNYDSFWRPAEPVELGKVAEKQFSTLSFLLLMPRSLTVAGYIL